MRSVYIPHSSETGLEAEDALRKDYHLMAFNWFALSFPWKMDHLQVKLWPRHECPNWQTLWMTQINHVITLTSFETSTDHMKGGLGPSKIPEGLVSTQTHFARWSGLCDCTSQPLRMKTQRWVSDIYSSWCKQLCEVTYPQGVVFHNKV